MLITFHINREVRLTLTHLIDTDGKISREVHISVQHPHEWLNTFSSADGADSSSAFPFEFCEFYVIFCG